MNEDHLKLILPEIFEELNIIADEKQINKLANVLSLLSDETFTYAPKDINYEQNEIDRLKKELDFHKSATWCPKCKGSGRVEEVFPGFSSSSGCYECNGEGKVK